jgi:heterodisulfide reductase subunit C
MMALDLSQNKHADVSYDEKERLFDEVKTDERWSHVLYGCYECGICVAACPSARFYDFSPRVIAQAVAREDVDLIYTVMSDSIWDCSQCFSCDRCPRQNSPGQIITIMREVAVKNGLQSAKEALQGYGRIIYKIMLTGTQVSPDMLQPDAFPDWGTHVYEIAENLGDWRNALPPETMHTTETSWTIDDKTIIELYLIWHMTGVMELIAGVDEGLYDIIVDVMEERLEEAGYDDVTFD